MVTSEPAIARSRHRNPDHVTLAAAVAIGELLNADRLMAHEHAPPAGYVAAFEPNVTVQGGVVTTTARQVPMTAERIRAIEAEWRERVRQSRLGQ